MKITNYHLHILFESKPTEKIIKVGVAADHANWNYQLGEQVNFTITVTKNGSPVPNASVRYEIGPEKQESTQKKSVIAATGIIKIDGGTLNKAGFLRCIAIAQVDGKEYRNLATAGFTPGNIQPTVENPADFDAFWQKAKEDLAKIGIEV
jgi:hypothetical protein